MTFTPEEKRLLKVSDEVVDGDRRRRVPATWASAAAIGVPAPKPNTQVRSWTPDQRRAYWRERARLRREKLIREIGIDAYRAIKALEARLQREKRMARLGRDGYLAEKREWYHSRRGER